MTVLLSSTTSRKGKENCHFFCNLHLLLSALCRAASSCGLILSRQLWKFINSKRENPLVSDKPKMHWSQTKPKIHWSQTKPKVYMSQPFVRLKIHSSQTEADTSLVQDRNLILKFCICWALEKKPWGRLAWDGCPQARILTSVRRKINVRWVPTPSAPNRIGVISWLKNGVQ